MQTQCERLHDALKKGPVNPLQAWDQIGIYRLSARAHDLRKAGINVQSRTIEVRNRFGEVCRVSEYYLEGVCE